MSEEKQLEVFGTKEVSVKEFMGSSSKSLVLLSDYEKAKENLYELKERHQDRVDELVLIEKLSVDELKELNSIRAELREPRYLIQNIEKNNVSVFESYKKTDKANLKSLIEINNTLEEKATEKLQAEEARKKAEKELEAKADELRIARIKSDIENIETYCLEIIQKMTFDNLKVSTESVEQSLNGDYDFEEYDLILDQVKDRTIKLLLEKTNDITSRERQRVENESMKQEIYQVRVNRLKEVGFDLHNGIFMCEELSLSYQDKFIINASGVDFESILSDIKKEKERIEKNKLDAEIKQQKDEQFNIRKNRIFEIGFKITENFHFMICKQFPNVSIHTDFISRASNTEFEEILSKLKQSIIDAEEKAYQEEKQKAELNKIAIANKKKADIENKARIKRLSTDKKIISESLEVYFAYLHLETENQEIKDFIEVVNNQIKELKTYLLTKLNEL